MAKRTFAKKMLSKISKIDRNEIENFLIKVLQEKDLLTIIFDSLSRAIIVTDDDDKIIFHNESFFKILGIKKRNLIGKDLLTIITDKELVDFFLTPIPEKARIVTDDNIFVKEPIKKMYSASIIPLTDDDGQSLGYIYTVLDVTEQKMIEEEKIREAHIAALAQLTSGIAHEIKNPLNSLSIHAQLINKIINHNNLTKPNIEKIKNSNKIILDEISRLSRIVDDFLTAVRPTVPTLTEVNVNEILDKAVAILSAEAKQRNILIIKKYYQDMPHTLVDEHQILKAFINIIKNSIEAIDKTEGEITITTYVDKGSIKIEIADDGCGIPEEDIKKIFEPYYTTKFYGTGLGLTIVYRVIKAHQGLIEIDSNVDEGTKFTIFIPIKHAARHLLTEK